MIVTTAPRLNTWQDFAIHPRAMVERAWAGPLDEGHAIPQGLPADTIMLNGVQQEMLELIEQIRTARSVDLEGIEGRFTRLAAHYGVDLRFSRGVPTVNWIGFPRLEVSHTGGPSAAHELVHVFQCVLGGAAALGSQAARNFEQKHGRPARSAQELQPELKSLTSHDKEQAYRLWVKPMETHAYSRYEESAFEVAGMFGKKSRDTERYCDKLRETVSAFKNAYETATVPVLDSGMDARLYGGVGHIARSHGEAALLLGVTGTAYYGLSRAAFAIHPMVGMATMAPLGYMLYRCLAG